MPLRKLALALALVLSPAQAQAQDLSPIYYDIGTPTLTDVYVDPGAGDDNANGTTPATALRTVNEAWNRIPARQTLSGTGFRLMLMPGSYPESSLPNFWESRYGTAQFPIALQAADGPGTVFFKGDVNAFDCRYLYFINIDITPDPAGDTFHCELCDHLLLRGMTLNGAGDGARAAQETLKVNQSQFVYIENSNISGAQDNPIDFVAVQYGHIVGNRIHNGTDWCIYLKGGSAYFRVEANEIFNCGTGGFTAGQGTGFEFMTSPWLHYEAYDIKFVNNLVRDTEGAGIGVNGGYNILIDHNTLFRVGSRSHSIEVVYGLRTCDGTTEKCRQYQSAGGWGQGVVGVEEPIPNRNVYIYNNVLYNPLPFRSADAVFSIQGPRTAGAGSNIPTPLVTDTNLQIRGNLIWNGPGVLPLGVEDGGQGCQPSNQTCNASQLASENTINTAEPQLANAAGGDLRPLANGNLFSATAFAVPAFSGEDRQAAPLAPEGNLGNLLTRDRGAVARGASSPPGAYAGASSPIDIPSPGGDFPSVPGDPGSGPGDPGIDPGDDAPTISNANIRVKRQRGGILINVKRATVSDDIRVRSVRVEASSSGGGNAGSFAIKKPRGKRFYKGSKKLRLNPGEITVTIVATDNNGNVTRSERAFTVN